MRAKELCPPLFNEARGFVFSFLAKRLPKADVLQQCVLVGGRARGELSSTVRAIFWGTFLFGNMGESIEQIYQKKTQLEVSWLRLDRRLS